MAERLGFPIPMVRHSHAKVPTPAPARMHSGWRLSCSGFPNLNQPSLEFLGRNLANLRGFLLPGASSGQVSSLSRQGLGAPQPSDMPKPQCHIINTRILDPQGVSKLPTSMFTSLKWSQVIALAQPKPRDCRQSCPLAPFPLRPRDPPPEAPSSWGRHTQLVATSECGAQLSQVLEGSGSV